MISKKLNWPILFVLILGIVSAINIAKSDDDEDEKDEHHERSQKSAHQEIKKINTKSETPALNLVNAKFKTECSSCHMLYPPELLPERSWVKMMGELKNHFGENAELDAQTQKEVTEYLKQNSADKVYSKRGSRILSGIKSTEAPQRISQTTYFIQKHDELSPSIYKRKAIGSAANCIACHSGAEKGDFSEDNVRIPKDNEVKKIKK